MARDHRNCCRLPHHRLHRLLHRPVPLLRRRVLLRLLFLLQCMLSLTTGQAIEIRQQPTTPTTTIPIPRLHANTCADVQPAAAIRSVRR